MTLKDWQVISDQQTLNDWANAVRSAPYFCADTEFRRENTYFAELALIQVATDQHLACIDPLASLDLSPLTDLLSSETPTYFHSIYQDAEILFTELQCRIGKPYDTQIAASFGNHASQISYRDAVELAVGIELDKGATRSNWMRRPLSDEQIHYAKLDVLHLAAVAEHFHAALSPQAQAWTWQESARVCADACELVTPTKLIERIKLRDLLPQAAQHRLIALHHWREEVAIARNLPRKWIIEDHSLRQIAELNSLNLDSAYIILQQDTQFSRSRHPEKTLKSLDACLQHLANNQLPFVMPEDIQMFERDSHQKAKLKQYNRYGEWIARQHQIPQSFLASQKMIRALMLGLPSTLSEGWRAELIGTEISHLLSGEKILTFDQENRPIIAANTAD